jgi:hypothetical protein
MWSDNTVFTDGMDVAMVCMAAQDCTEVPLNSSKEI